MNYLNVYYSLGSSNVTVNDGTNYIFRDISILSLYITYEEPSYLIDITLYLFDNQGNTLYSEGGYNSLTFPTVTFNYQKIGYNDGYNDGFDAGEIYGYDIGYYDGNEDGYAFGYADGIDSVEGDFNFIALLQSTGALLTMIFTTEIFEGITIGLFILIPLLLALLGLFLRLRKGG